jgi:hypothetical protein
MPGWGLSCGIIVTLLSVIVLFQMACRNVPSKFSIERIKATTALPVDLAPE